ncbi:MAG: carbon-nitrogen hydrolase family protein [Bacteroidota bacterium]
MKIAAAQTKPIDGNIEANLAAHFHLAAKAADYGVQLIVFPELSLTGYQRESASQLAFIENDSRLDKLKSLAVDKNIITVIGAPIQIKTQLHIGTFILHPDNSTSIYTKQFLHQGEEVFFAPNFEFNPTIKLEDELISLAICADITNPLHPANASKNKTTLYVASLFYTPNGIAEAFEQLSQYANLYAMNILMANYTGQSYIYDAAGQSAFWNNKGHLITQLTSDEEALLIVTKENNQWYTLQITA